MAVALHGAGLAHHIAAWQQKTRRERDAGPLLTMLARDSLFADHQPGRGFRCRGGLLRGAAPVMQYEGQAAMLLEGLAAQYGPVPPLADGWRILPGHVLDLSPPLWLACLRPTRRTVPPLFHATLTAAPRRRQRPKGILSSAGEPGKMVKTGRFGGCAMNGVDDAVAPPS